MTDKQQPATRRYNHKPIQMERHESAVSLNKVGDFYWKFDDDNRRSLVVNIPNLNTRGYTMSEWTIDYKNECDVQWTWDGNEDKPTLTPSLHAVGVWHGKVTAGQLVEA